MATNIPVFVQHGRANYLAYLIDKNEVNETATIRWDWDTIGKPDIVPLSSVQFISSERARRRPHLPECKKENNQRQTQPKHHLIDDADISMSKNSRTTRSRSKVTTKTGGVQSKKSTNSSSANNIKRYLRKHIKRHGDDTNEKNSVLDKKRVTRSKSRALDKIDGNGDENLTTPSSANKATVVCTATNDTSDDNIAIKKQKTCHVSGTKESNNVSNNKRITRSKSRTPNKIINNGDENLTTTSSANKATVVGTATNNSSDNNTIRDKSTSEDNVLNNKRITRSKSRTPNKKNDNKYENLTTPSSANKATIVGTATNNSSDNNTIRDKSTSEDNTLNNKRITRSKSRTPNKKNDKDENLTTPSSANKATVVGTETYDSSDDNMTKDEPLSKNLLSLHSDKSRDGTTNQKMILRGVTYTIKTKNKIPSPTEKGTKKDINKNRDSLDSLPTPHSYATKKYIVIGDDASFSSFSSNDDNNDNFEKEGKDIEELFNSEKDEKTIARDTKKKKSQKVKLSNDDNNNNFEKEGKDIEELFNSEKDEKTIASDTKKKKSHKVKTYLV